MTKSDQRKATQDEIAPQWQAWIAANLARGADPCHVQATLIEEGVPATLAQAQVKHLLASPVLRACSRLVTPTVEFCKFPGAAAFFADYWQASRAVVFTDFMATWPALTRWTPDDLARRVGEEMVEVVIKRDEACQRGIEFAGNRHVMRFCEYVALVKSAGVTNDFYMIAKGRNVARPGLQILFEDIKLPAELFEAQHVDKGSALWFGPAGTITPLHHDTSNILFCQIHGRKEVRLIAPGSRNMWDFAHGLYSRHDPMADPELFAELGGQMVQLGPGDALFIPIGWWHHVRSLDVSISLALNNFVVPNAYDWYKPGVSQK